MRCEFCREEIRDDAEFCEFCGSNVRKLVLRDKGNIILSHEQQSEIKTHKLRFDYKLPKNENIIRERPDEEGLFLTQASIDSRSVGHGKVNLRKNNVSFAEENNENIPQTAGASGSGKVNLKKNAAPKNTGSEYREYYAFVERDTTRDPYAERNTPNIIYLQDRAILQKGLAKNDIMQLHFLHDLRSAYCVGLILMYICLVCMLIAAIICRSPVYLVEDAVALGCTLGVQFKLNYKCAWINIIVGTISTAVNLILYLSLGGLCMLISGLLMLMTVSQLERLWKDYQTTGSVPYKKHKSNNNLRV